MDTTALPDTRSRSFARAFLDRIGSWDILLLATIVLLGAEANWGVGMFNDIGLGDETRYLYAGITGDLPSAPYSPLYCSWYFLLSLVQSDPIDLYFLNWFLLPILLGVGMYLLIRSLGGAEFPAFLSAAAVLLCRVYAIWPRPTHFAVCLLLFGLAASFAFRGVSARLAGATITLGVVAFVRPEFAVSFVALALVLFLVLIWDGYRDRSRIGRCLGLGVAAVLPAVRLSLQFGSPLGGERSDFAFGQHYALNIYQAGLMDKQSNPWYNFREILKRDFSVSSIGPLEAFWISPENFLWHVSRNVENVFINIGNILDSESSEAVEFLLLGYVLFVIVSACAIAWARLRKSSWPEIVSSAGTPAIVGLAVIAPVLAECLVIYPRQHYLLCLLLVPLALMTSLLAWGTLPRFLTPSRFTAALIAGAIVLLAPNHYVGWDYGRLLAAVRSSQDSTAAQPVINAVKMIREIPLKGPLRVAGTAFSSFVYTGLQFTFVSPFRIGQDGYAAFLKKHDINVVVLRPSDTRIAWLRKDDYFMRFRKTPPTDWVIIGKPGVMVHVAVRRDALAVSFRRLENIVALPSTPNRP